MELFMRNNATLLMFLSHKFRLKYIFQRLNLIFTAQVIETLPICLQEWNSWKNMLVYKTLENELDLIDRLNVTHLQLWQMFNNEWNPWSSWRPQVWRSFFLLFLFTIAIDHRSAHTSYALSSQVQLLRIYKLVTVRIVIDDYCSRSCTSYLH